jgi:hypothetical protein
MEGATKFGSAGKFGCLARDKITCFREELSLTLDEGVRIRGKTTTQAKAKTKILELFRR